MQTIFTCPFSGKRTWRHLPAVIFWRSLCYCVPYRGFPASAVWSWSHGNWYAAEERFEGRL